MKTAMLRMNSDNFSEKSHAVRKKIMDEVVNLKPEYNIDMLKSRGHPLREKIKKGEITLLNPFDISSEEFNKKIAELNPDEQDFIINIRNIKYANANKNID